MPREGHDVPVFRTVCATETFQSTCPARGTTCTGISTLFTVSDFNPRAPRGARREFISGVMQNIRFQSTCPARGTTTSHRTISHKSDFNPRAPRGARPPTSLPVKATRLISIHVPREGHDQTHQGGKAHNRFQSTCPARGTTSVQMAHVAGINNFNPRAPRGARQHPG